MMAASRRRRRRLQAAAAAWCCVSLLVPRKTVAATQLRWSGATRAAAAATVGQAVEAAAAALAPQPEGAVRPLWVGGIPPAARPATEDSVSSSDVVDGDPLLMHGSEDTLVQPQPPRPPAMRPTDCLLLQEGMVVEPKASCAYVNFADNWDGCTCSINLPATINPQPDMYYDPYAPDSPPGDGVTAAPPFPSAIMMQPPTNPLQPYVPPAMKPECPYTAKCGGSGGGSAAETAGEGCIGYDSWGFDDARMAGYSPAAAHINVMSCSYIMKTFGQFRVPDKVQAYLDQQKQLAPIIERYKSSFDVECVFGSKTYVWATFCKNLVEKVYNTPCSKQWWQAVKLDDCVDAHPPLGRTKNSTVAEMCPLDCGSGLGAVNSQLPPSTPAPPVSSAVSSADWLIVPAPASAATTAAIGMV